MAKQNQVQILRSFGGVSKIKMFKGGEVEILMDNMEVYRIVTTIREYFEKSPKKKAQIAIDAAKTLEKVIFGERKLKLVVEALIANHETDLEVVSKL
jgi:cyanophycinase-like exopeptidase